MKLFAKVRKYIKQGKLQNLPLILQAPSSRTARRRAAFIDALSFVNGHTGSKTGRGFVKSRQERREEARAIAKNPASAFHWKKVA